MTKDEQQPEVPPPGSAAAATPAELTRLEYLFRHRGAQPEDHFLFDLVRRYRLGEMP